MSAPTHTAPARGFDRRVLLAVATLAAAVIACIGIQSVANRVAAPRSPQEIAAQALAPAQAAAQVAVDATAQTASPAAQPGDFPIVLAVVLLVLAGGVRLAVRARTGGGRMYWDELPWS
jgi:hypothetical protein